MNDFSPATHGASFRGHRIKKAIPIHAVHEGDKVGSDFMVLISDGG